MPNPNKVSFLYVYIECFSLGENDPVKLTEEEVMSMVGIVDDPEAFERGVVKNVTKVMSMLLMMQTIPEKTCSWDLNPREFIPPGPYILAVEEIQSGCSGHFTDVVRGYLGEKCPWTRNLRLRFVIFHLKRGRASTENYVSFQMPNDRFLRVKRNQVLHIKEGCARLGV